MRLPKITWSIWLIYVVLISVVLVVWAAIGSHGTFSQGYFSYDETGPYGTMTYTEYPGVPVFRVVAAVLILFAAVLFFAALIEWRRSRPKHFKPQFVVVAHSFCDKCGFGLGPKSVFCPNCGNKVNE